MDFEGIKSTNKFVKNNISSLSQDLSAQQQ